MSAEIESLSYKGNLFVFWRCWACVCQSTAVWRSSDTGIQRCHAALEAHNKAYHL